MRRFFESAAGRQNVQFQVKPVFISCIEPCLPIVSALDDMLRDAGNVRAGRARYVMPPYTGGITMTL